MLFKLVGVTEVKKIYIYIYMKKKKQALCSGFYTRYIFFFDFVILRKMSFSY